MNELLLMNARKKMIEGGPGPSTIIKGDSNSGYFGTLPASEIFTGAGLSANLGITQGQLINDDAAWLKFAHKGKIKYMPMKPLRLSCSWEHLLARGVAFHQDDPESALLSPGMTWVPQNRIATHSAGYEFEVHLPNTIDGQYHNDPGGYIVAGSELYDLLLRVCVTWPGGAATRFADFTEADLMDASGGGAVYLWSREAYTGQTSWRLCPLYIRNTISGYGFTYDTRNIIGWRPVLELLP